MARVLLIEAIGKIVQLKATIGKFDNNNISNEERRVLLGVSVINVVFSPNICGLIPSHIDATIERCQEHLLVLDRLLEMSEDHPESVD